MSSMDFLSLVGNVSFDKDMVVLSTCGYFTLTPPLPFIKFMLRHFSQADIKSFLDLHGRY